MTTASDELRQALKQEASRAAADLISSDLLRRLLETLGQIDERYWQHCRDQGWTAIGIPEAYGGIGLGLAEICILAQSGGQAAGGMPLLESGFAMAQALLRSDNQGLKAHWLPQLASGASRGLLSIVDSSDLIPGQSGGLSWKDGHLHGFRRAVPVAAIADVAILSVETSDGCALALVDLAAPDVTRTVIDSFDNSRCAADLTFDEVAAELLHLQSPRAAIEELLDMQAAMTAYQQIGGADTMLQAARDYALQRRAFGQPIGAFQSVKHRIAEGYVLVELARASAETAVANIGTVDFGRSAMAARLLATEAYEAVTRDAVQMHGGIGVTWEADLHLHQRRARTLALELGPIMAWDDRLAETLCGDPE